MHISCDWMGKNANFGFLIFFQVQAFWVVLFASLFNFGKKSKSINSFDHIGLIIWLIGFSGVYLADKQLKTFKADPDRTRADVCRVGLWKYSRHPNYFFEWVLWIGYIFIGWQGSVWRIVTTHPINSLYLSE